MLVLALYRSVSALDAGVRFGFPAIRNARGWFARTGRSLMSWWEFGEHSGYSGTRLGIRQIACAFCSERGNFETAHSIEKRNPASGKVLNFDTLKCTNCGNFTMVFWSAARMGGGSGIHDYIQIPYARKTSRHPDHWPADVGRFWMQAKRSLEGENWDAAALLARSAVQLTARLQGAHGRNLKEEIDDLATRGLLPPIMKDWSHDVRVLGNDSAHPTPGSGGVDPKDASDVVQFLTMLLTMVYDLPHEIENYRKRKAP